MPTAQSCDPPPAIDREVSLEQVTLVLCQSLGCLAVAQLAGVRDRRVPMVWTLPGAPGLTAAQATRLWAAWASFTAIRAAAGSRAAADWLERPNAVLGGHSPVAALHEGRFEQLTAATRAAVQLSTALVPAASAW